MSLASTHQADATALIVQPSSRVLLNGWGTAFSWFLAYFLISRYILEPLLPRVHRQYWSQLSLPDQRSFTIHHHWLLVKGCCIVAAWPYTNIMFRSQSLAAPLFGGTTVTNADMLSVFYMAILSSFAWEVCYRCKISVVSLVHHGAAIVLGSWQLSGEVAAVPYTSVVPPGGNFIDTRANDQQFKIIMTYGLFEVVFESWMHVCCILHKRYAGQYTKIARLWALGGCWVLAGSLAELGIMAALWRLYWNEWENSMRVVMVLLHFAFMAAQLHGARIGLMLVRKYRRKVAEERSPIPPADDLEASLTGLPSLTGTANDRTGSPSEAQCPLEQKEAGLPPVPEKLEDHRKTA